MRTERVTPPLSRREASRRAVTLPCQAVREQDFELVADRTLDMSTEGLLLPLRTQVLTGESLIVSFALPGMWIDVEATVARIVHGRRPGDDGLAAGVLFDPLSPSARAALAGFLYTEEAPLPCPVRGSLTRLTAPSLARRQRAQVDGVGVLSALFSAWRDLLDASPLEQGPGGQNDDAAPLGRERRRGSALAKRARSCPGVRLSAG